MLTANEALARILAAISPLDPMRAPLLDAAGRVLAEPIVARRQLPGFDNSAMDGYAVNAADVPKAGTTLPVVDLIAAGDPGDRRLRRGTCARIFTGAPVPEGADAIILQEDTTRAEDRATFNEAPTPGQHVRRAGSDVQVGDLVLPAGRALMPGDLALLAAQGRSQVAVVRPPAVAITSTGDELIDVDGGEPGPGQVVNGNSIALAAAVAAIGAIPRVLPALPDDREATLTGLRRAARADVLITTGGASVGEFDHVTDALRTLGGDRFGFWKVAIKPGKPLAFGQIDSCFAFALPGNPISALVTFELFVRPALLRLMGHWRVCRQPVMAICDAPLSAGGGRQEYLRAAMRMAADGWHVDPQRSQSSGALSSLAGADALVVLPPGAPAQAAGEKVTTLILGPDGPNGRVLPPAPGR